MRKERFLEQRKSKLQARADGPFQVTRHLNNNAYQLDLPGEYKVSATFNVADLSPFLGDSDLRTNPFEEEENDAIVPSQPRDVIEAPEGPMTRARTKRFKEQLNLFMASFFKEHEDARESKTTCVHVIQATEGYKISPTGY